MKVSRAQARRFLVERHGLAPPRALPAEPASVLTVVRRFGSVQFDPVESPGARNHEVVLHARIRGYQRGWCERWLYGPPGSRKLFEAYNKALNILPVEELPAHRFAWTRGEARHRAGLFKTHGALVATVLDGIRRDGPTGARAVSSAHGTSLPWHWAPTPAGRAALEALFEAGLLGIARREGNHRHFDLLERLLPEVIHAPRWTPEACVSHRLLSRHRAVGLLGAVGAAEVFGGLGGAAPRRAAHDALVAQGRLQVVNLEGERHPRFVLAEEREALGLAQEPWEPHRRGVAFLAPLDPMLWDRGLLSSLWDFHYRWELYTPEARRTHGAYVLPILWGERLVGRLEPTLDRARSRVCLRGLWFEAGFEPSSEPGFAQAFREALEAWRAFLGAATVARPRGRLGRLFSPP